MAWESCDRTGGHWRVFPRRGRDWEVKGGTGDARLFYDPLGYECVWEQFGFRMGVGFSYGVTEYGVGDEEEGSRKAAMDVSTFPGFPPHGWTQPFGFEERYNLTYEAWTSHYDSAPTLVMTAFGAWDFKTMFFNDIKLNTSLETIPPSLLTSFQYRAKNSFNLIRSLFPSSHHVYLNLHTVSTRDTVLREAWFRNAVRQPPPLPSLADRTLPLVFTRARINQLQQAYAEVTREVGVEVLDAKSLFEGLESERYLRDAIHPNAGLGNVWMWEMVLESLWRVTGGVEEE
ncbi:hypothetical protein MNV49_001700 [Pseudohyphozyma bogoriensis]|nr:hypothetical protein MNV49_001700 [Pseudohyphozyma bogoriensis]